MRLPRINHGRRGPKRIAMAKKIELAARKNWRVRSSMIRDGLKADPPKHTPVVDGYCPGCEYISKYA